jgi:holo-[acyl-carrier protein] synthase
MLLGVGTDLMDVQRMADTLAADPGLAEQLFTPLELAYCRLHRYAARHFAARFAAKEALLKALPGPRLASIPWQEMEISNSPTGRPLLNLSGSLRDLAAALAVTTIHVSLSHTEQSAIAVVVLESAPDASPQAARK